MINDGDHCLNSSSDIANLLLAVFSTALNGLIYRDLTSCLRFSLQFLGTRLPYPTSSKFKFTSLGPHEMAPLLMNVEKS